MLRRFLGYDWTAGKITIRGHGDGPVSWTHRLDIARFVLYVITHHPIEKLTGRAIRIEGDRAVRALHLVSATIDY